MLRITDLRKSYPLPNGARRVVLDLPALAVEAGEQVAVRGQSGAGKTTLLHLIAGILVPDSGSIVIDGVEMSARAEAQRDRLRAEKVGYVLQTFNLLQGFTALENVLFGMAFGSQGVDRDRARELLARMGLADRLHDRPRQLSTGQQQRVAIARALAGRPKLVLADEPTGNLDRAHAREALQLIREGCRESGAALLLVSHDEATLGEFERVIELTPAGGGR